jgi:hypothetical protein
MLRKPTFLPLTLAALALAAGCDHGSKTPLGGGETEVTAYEMAEVALESDEWTEQAVSAELDAIGSAPISGGGSGVVTQDVTFSRTRPCPAGGTFGLDGTIHRTFNLATREMEAESAGNRTRSDCALHRGEFTITVNGTAEWDAFRRRLAGEPDGLQTSHYSGAFAAVRSDGAARSCAFEVTIVRDPASHTRTLDGTICGTEIHRSVTWSHEE